jgi:hypothetical protein
MRSAFVTAALLCCWVPASYATHYTPARISEGNQSIEAWLRLPAKLEKRSYVVKCSAVISKFGRTRRFFCYSPDATVPQKVVSAVTDAGWKATWVPATRDGWRVSVWMVLSARIMITDGAPLVLIVPNDGADAARYGQSYSAPQRFNEFTWSDEFTHRSPRVVWVWERLVIDEHGALKDFVLGNYSGAPEPIVEEIRRSVSRMTFIPGFYQGKPVPMVLLEPAVRDPRLEQLFYYY